MYFPGLSPQTAHDKGITESQHQNVASEKGQDKTGTPDDDIIRCNPSSIKYRSKIEELQKNPPRKKSVTSTFLEAIITLLALEEVALYISA